MKPIITTFSHVGIACAFLSSCAHVQSSDNEIFGRLEGRWDLISNPSLCKTGVTIQIIHFSSDRRTVYFEHPNPPVGAEDLSLYRYSYTVIYSGPHSVTMHLTGEDRRLPTGDDYIWIMEEPEQNVFAWRLYGYPLRDPEPATFRKCT